MPDIRIATLALVTAIVLFGTIYSVINNTYLDTSNPLLSHLPHPLHNGHYFAAKENALNVYFIKRILLWVAGAFLAHFCTSPPAARTKERVFQFLAVIGVWLVFTRWFFGPPVLDRLIVNTGGECIVNLPSGAVVSVPHELCYTKSTISTATNSALFPAALVLPEGEWKAMPRLRRGHDVSGHIFLLTMTILFLVDQVAKSFTMSHSNDRSQTTWPSYHKWAVLANVLVIAASLFASYTTAVYFHTPFEKLTGYLLGVAGFAVTQLPAFLPAPEAAVISNRPTREEAIEKKES